MQKFLMTLRVNHVNSLKTGKICNKEVHRMATITRRGKSYSIRVSCGYDMTGRQIIKSMTWKPQPDMTDAQAEKEAQRQAVLFEEKCRTGQVLQGNVRFADFAEIWLRD